MNDKTNRRLAMLAALLLLAACGDRNDAPWSGYAEAEYVYVSAPLAGTLSTLHVQAGEQVARGKPLFALESEAEKAAREEASARLEAARYQAENTDKGKREPEVAVNQAQLAQARAQAELAELSSVVQVARMPAREDERAAADAQVEAARQVLKQSEWRQQQKAQAAPADAQVADTFFRPGEFVAAGQPVVALLPPGNLKARFYVPEADLQRVTLGQTVQLECDGCGAAIAARVTHIATRPEYTPPVIYSNSQRSKLVFMVEAHPAPADARRLRPGQPLGVRPQAAAAK